MQVAVGRIVKAHGVRGELAVELRTDSPEQRFAVGARLIGRSADGTTRPLTVAASRPHGERMLVRFTEVSGRDAAETVRGYTLLAETADLEPIEDPDEFYDHELAGLRAELADGAALGSVTEVVHAPGGELLALRKDGGGTVLVPFVRQIVTEVDVAGGRVCIDPPEGLLDDE